jgi:flagellar basal body-associated protein FliL
MSTILDALKKSEQERKLNNIPTLSDMVAPDEERRLPWLWLVILLLLGLLVGLAIYLFNNVGQSDSRSEQASPQEIVVSNETIAVEQEQVALKVNVVSWSEQPTQRFVIVDGKLARENEFIRPGLKVEMIKPDSVVLIDRGERVEISP